MAKRPREEGQEAPAKRTSGPITLNVGGTLFVTTLTTLLQLPDTYFTARFGPDARFTAEVLPDGSHFIDHDPVAFDALLRGMRTGVIPSRVPAYAALSQEDWESTLLFYGIRSIEPPTPTPPPPQLKLGEIYATNNDEILHCLAEWILRSDACASLDAHSSSLTIQLLRVDLTPYGNKPICRMWTGLELAEILGREDNRRKFKEALAAKVVNPYFISRPVLLRHTYVVAADGKILRDKAGKPCIWPDQQNDDCLAIEIRFI